MLCASGARMPAIRPRVPTCHPCAPCHPAAAYTLPCDMNAHRNEAAKQSMCEAALTAGLIKKMDDEQLLIVLVRGWGAGARG